MDILNQSALKKRAKREFGSLLTLEQQKESRWGTLLPTRITSFGNWKQGNQDKGVESRDFDD